jgi:two-component system LytT family response regulator
MMLTVIIIDDEAPAVNTLELLIKKHLPDVRISGSTTDAYKGIALIEEHKPEVVFLDITMPELDGFTLLSKLLFKDFNLIFTTAYENDAIQAIKNNAFEYLLKPIDANELLAAIQRVQDGNKKLSNKSPDLQTQVPSTHGRIGIRVKEGLVYLDIADIIWIESKGNYCIFYATHSRKYLASKNIGEYDGRLPANTFFRVHKSFLINVTMVKRYIRSEGYFVEMTDGTLIEVSRRKRDAFLQFMKEN